MNEISVNVDVRINGDDKFLNLKIEYFKPAIFKFENNFEIDTNLYSVQVQLTDVISDLVYMEFAEELIDINELPSSFDVLIQVRSTENLLYSNIHRINKNDNVS